MDDLANEVSEAPKPRPATVVPGPPAPPRARFPLIFAIIGLVLALVAGAFYAYRELTTPPPRSAEDTVRAFLAAVFVDASPEQVGHVVCRGWDPVDALARTAGEVGTHVDVSWDEFRAVAESADRVTIMTRLGFRVPDEARPTTYRQWRFNLVDEDGWRVCEARPLDV